MKVKRLLFAFVLMALIFTGQARSARSLADSSGSFELVSVASDGTLGNGSSGSPSLSADGRYVAFDSGSSNLVDGDTNDQSDVFVHDRLTGITERVSVSSAGEQGNSYSGGPVISADGRFVGFSSGASNLVSGDTNGWNDVFVHDRLTGTTERVSVSPSGEQIGGLYSKISSDGRYVAFLSYESYVEGVDTGYVQNVYVYTRPEE